MFVAVDTAENLRTSPAFGHGNGTHGVHQQRLQATAAVSAQYSTHAHKLGTYYTGALLNSWRGQVLSLRDQDLELAERPVGQHDVSSAHVHLAWRPGAAGLRRLEQHRCERSHVQCGAQRDELYTLSQDGHIPGRCLRVRMARQVDHITRSSHRSYESDEFWSSRGTGPLRACLLAENRAVPMFHLTAPHPPDYYVTSTDQEGTFLRIQSWSRSSPSACCPGDLGPRCCCLPRCVSHSKLSPGRTSVTL